MSQVNDEGTKKDDPKAPENKGGGSEELKNLTPAELAERLEKVQSDNRELLHEVMDKKNKLKKLDSERELSERKRLEEQEKFKELYESSKPRLERLDAMEATFTNLFEKEVEGIAEEKRDLIPDLGTVEKKYEWVMNAKTKGLFDTPKANDGSNPKSGNTITSIGGRPATKGGIPEFLNWDSKDARLTSLSTNEYVMWKNHKANQNRSSAVAGWGKA